MSFVKPLFADPKTVLCVLLSVYESVLNSLAGKYPEQATSLVPNLSSSQLTNYQV